jgi:hypothetical protein
MPEAMHAVDQVQMLDILDAVIEKAFLTVGPELARMLIEEKMAEMELQITPAQAANISAGCPLRLV